MGIKLGKASSVMGTLSGFTTPSLFTSIHLPLSISTVSKAGERRILTDVIGRVPLFHKWTSRISDTKPFLTCGNNVLKPNGASDEFKKFTLPLFLDLKLSPNPDQDITPPPLN